MLCNGSTGSLLGDLSPSLALELDKTNKHLLVDSLVDGGRQAVRHHAQVDARTF